MDLLSKSEYYPFGMQIEDLSYQTANSRYSYNSQEKDVELNKNMLSAEFWEYDARSGRRWNSDPVDQIYRSNYATFANNPIAYNDLNGDFSLYTNGTNNKDKDDNSVLEGVKYTAEVYSSKVNRTEEVLLQLFWKNKLDESPFGEKGLYGDKGADSPYFRKAEGKRLAKEVYKQYIECYMGEDITLIGYSNGGNVNMYLAEELDNLLEGKVKINIITLSTPLDNTQVLKLMEKKNILIDHYYVEDDNTVTSAGHFDSWGNNVYKYVMNGKDIGNLNQTHIPSAQFKAISDAFPKETSDYDNLVKYGFKDGIWQKLRLEGGNHGWPYYPNFVKSIVTKKKRK